MKSIKSLLLAITMLLSYTLLNAQIKNAETETVKVYGACGMCKSKIEKAGNLKKTAQVNWDKSSKMATITFDSSKTNLDEVLKRIALAGYDSEKFLAPDNVYNKLDDCCKYDREAKFASNVEVSNTEKSNNKLSENGSTNMTTSHPFSELNHVFEGYFDLKDALVKSDNKTASAKAADLLKIVHSVKMDKLTMKEHTEWMKTMKSIAVVADLISKSNDIAKQRAQFDGLSKNIYALMKVSKLSDVVYFQHCPMYNNGKGGDWLSKENAIKNPYYGSQMLSCGKTVETLK